MSKTQGRISKSPAETYARFGVINGDHDFRKAVPDGFVDYEVRNLRGGRVAYFNYALAREMGLISEEHAPLMNAELEKAILDTFALQIINEYDILNRVRIPAKDIRPGKYMATRYLQLQHPCKRGTTSGDGRSIWNGQITHKGVIWDTSSCGTGATRLSPSAAKSGVVPKTGDYTTDYGCGKACVDEGLTAAIQSEIFHRNGITTERTLASIAFPDGTGINVRAGNCLLRPSHFFHHLKQGNLASLKGAIDYFVRRQVRNRIWPELASARKPYSALASRIAGEFARMAARFEAEYIFVWMDWDGDNILANGGIIDYGSVRQFGLYHREYRFDDGDRWSTNLPEQRIKARQMVQTFIQIADFLETGIKRNHRSFSSHPVLFEFDREFDREMQRHLLKQIGFDDKQREFLMSSRLPIVRGMRKAFSSFERASRSRKYRVPDGVTRDAVYCMRDVLRELPARMLAAGSVKAAESMDARVFLDCIASSYSCRKDRMVTPWRALRIKCFMKYYEGLVRAVQTRFGTKRETLIGALKERAAFRNPRERITGTSLIVLTDKLIRSRSKGLTVDELQSLIDGIVRSNIYDPSALALRADRSSAGLAERTSRLFRASLRIVDENSEGL